ncbi:MAG TPA: hypothetical protein VE439_06680 [Anaerolineae bacterium]|nr:hypothetical protein [Anaerolineae bacterium]
MIASVFRSAYGFFRKYWITLILALMLTVGTTEALFGSRYPVVVIISGKNDYVLTLLRLIILLAGVGMFEGITVRLALREVQGDNTSLLRIVRQLLLRLPLIIIVELLSMILVFAGVLALAIPGIIAIVWFILVVQVAATEEQRGIINIFRRSRALVKGRFWQVLGSMLIVITPFAVAYHIIGSAILEGGIVYGWENYGISIVPVVGHLFIAIVGAFVYLELSVSKK